VYDGLETEATETAMTVYNVDLLADHNVPEYGEEGEDSREGGFAVNDEEGYVVDFEAVGEIADACAASVCVGYYYDFVTTVNEFLPSVSNASTSRLWYELTLDSWYM
jgi:hypothetical protein